MQTESSIFPFYFFVLPNLIFNSLSRPTITTTCPVLDPVGLGVVQYMSSATWNLGVLFNIQHSIMFQDVKLSNINI